MDKSNKKILATLGIFSLAGSFMYTYQEMWLLSSGLSTGTISTIFSLAALLTIFVLYICSSLVRRDKLKTFICGLLLSKVVTSLILFMFYKTDFLMLIKFITLVEYVIDVEIFVSIYPLMSYINKNNKEFALRDIVYDASFFGGSLICFILLKYGFFKMIVSYNTYVLISSILYLIAFIFLNTVKIDNKKVEESNIVSYDKLFKKLKGDKISLFYLLFHLFTNISFYSISGTIMILLTEGLNTKVTTASFILIVFGLVSALLGYITLSKFKFKNDKINLGIKYGGRGLFYLLAFLTGGKFFLIFAIIFSRLTVDSFINISDAPYTNRLDNKYQFSFSNLRNSIGYLGRSIGTLICGLLVVIDPTFNFLSAFVFISISIIFMYLAKIRLERENMN